MSRELTVESRIWPLRAPFSISRGSRIETAVVEVAIRDGAATGRGESYPFPRYGESVDSVAAQIRAIEPRLRDGLDRLALQNVLPAGAARFALDSALWDLEAKQTGLRAWQIAGLSEPGPVVTAMTISLDTPAKMGEAAATSAMLPLLKIKLTGGPLDLDRVRAVRDNAPDARLIVDANEAWSISELERFAPVLVDLGVEMIEQPLPAASDDGLAGFESPIAICADEACADRSALDGLVGKYHMINIKLDKAGGLTEGLALSAAARERGFDVMVGCMLGTSLSMAPAVLVAQVAKVVDLDGPLWMVRDQESPLTYEAGLVYPSTRHLWG